MFLSYTMFSYMGPKLCMLTYIRPEGFICNNTLKACPLTSRSPQTHTVRYTQLDTQADTGLRTQGRMELWGCRIGLGRRTRVPAGHHFLLLLGAVGGEVLDDDVRILEEHITDGLDRT